MQTAHTYVPSVELAERYGLTNDHIASLCRSGKILGERSGRVWMVDEESLKVHIAKMRRERDTRRRALSERFKRELRDKQETPSVTNMSARPMEWAFAVALVVAVSFGAARAGHIAALPPLPAPVRTSPSIADLSASGLAAARQATALQKLSSLRPTFDVESYVRGNAQDARRGALIVGALVRDAIAINARDTVAGAAAVADVLAFVPLSYGESSGVFVDATFGAGARAFVGAVALWGRGMDEGYRAAGERFASVARGVGAQLSLPSSDANTMSATIAVANHAEPVAAAVGTWTSGLSAALLSFAERVFGSPAPSPAVAVSVSTPPSVPVLAEGAAAREPSSGDSTARTNAVSPSVPSAAPSSAVPAALPSLPTPVSLAPYVTQDVLATQLSALENNLRQLVYRTTAAAGASAVPQYVAAGGNEENPYAGVNRISTLNNVTVTNSNVNIDLSGYLPIAGGTLTGALSATEIQQLYNAGR